MATEMAKELAALQRMPCPLRRVAQALRTHSIAAAARHLRMSRTTLYQRLAELREAFVAAGLEEIFSQMRTPRARRK